MGQEEAVSSLTVDNTYLRDKFRQCKNKLHSYRHLGWIILLVAAINVILIGGKRRAFGIFVTALHNEFTNTSMTELNWIGDSYAALGFFLMPFMTTAIVHAGRAYRGAMAAAAIFIFASCFTSAAVPSPGYLFFTHTILHGIGSTLILCTTAIITGEYFDKTHRFHVLATAFVSGGPYGVLIFGPLFALWTHNLGWRSAFQICGIVFATFNLTAAIFFQPKQDDLYQQVENDHDNDVLKSTEHNALTGRGWAVVSLRHLKENWQIALWGMERLIHNFVMYGLLMNMTTYITEEMGNEIQQGSKVNLYFGIGESLVFTLGAFVGDKIRGHLAKTYLVGAVAAAGILLIMQRFYRDVTTVLILSGFLGGAVGSGNTFLYATTEEVMRIHGSIAFPMTKMVAGIGMMISPLLSGTVIDAFSFSGFFISMTILVCLRVVLLVGICVILWRKKIREKIERKENVRLNPAIVTTAASPKRVSEALDAKPATQASPEPSASQE